MKIQPGQPGRRVPILFRRLSWEQREAAPGAVFLGAAGRRRSETCWHPISRPRWPPFRTTWGHGKGASCWAVSAPGAVVLTEGQRTLPTRQPVLLEG